jgi:Predicted dioxygenase
MNAIRPPAVAGTFYEASEAGLVRQVQACYGTATTRAPRQAFIGAVVPHAGLMYSGSVAAEFYGRADLPKRFIILCPNHTGAGHFAAINTGGSWRTPLGNVPVDHALAEALMARCPLLADDTRAHAREHSLEVQLPFLQHELASFSMVPICLGAPRYEVCQQIGEVIAEVVRGEEDRIGILASSDLNHYEDQATTLRKDQLVIDPILALDPAGLWSAVEKFDVSMCGFIPATTMLIAARLLGASEASLLGHSTSGDVNGDFSHVVGYASILVR